MEDNKNLHISGYKTKSQRLSPGDGCLLPFPNERGLPGCDWGGIFDKIVSYENLLLSWKRTERLRRYRTDVIQFRQNLDENLIDIHNHLNYGSYEVGEYRNFYVYEPKKRMIAALPLRDRVVQHAIHGIIEPLLDKKFFYDSHACRRGHGVQLAVSRAHKFSKRNSHVLKCDVSQYFPSIDHDILMSLYKRNIHCDKTIELIERIIRSTPGPGIPIGNLLSQLSANLYLHELDHFVKQELGVRDYCRYMDDFLMFCDSENQAKELLSLTREFLYSQLKLNLSDRKCIVFRTAKGFPFCGSTIFPTHTIIQNATLRKNRRKLRGLAGLVEMGEFPPTKFLETVDSLLGHCLHSRNYSHRKSLGDAICQETGVRI